MRELLTPADCGCASITPCCDPVYKPDAEDCIHRALYEMVASWSQDYLKKESFGMALGEDVTGIELRHAELHYAIWLVIHAHRERQIAFDATGVVPDQAIYWEKYKLGCVSDYLKSNYGVNGETFLGVAGFYDPERGNACVLTGCDPIIDTWPEPQPSEPIVDDIPNDSSSSESSSSESSFSESSFSSGGQDCIIPTVQGAIDAAFILNDMFNNAPATGIDGLGTAVFTILSDNSLSLPVPDWGGMFAGELNLQVGDIVRVDLDLNVYVHTFTVIGHVNVSGPINVLDFKNGYVFGNYTGSGWTSTFANSFGNIPNAYHPGLHGSVSDGFSDVVAFTVTPIDHEHAAIVLSGGSPVGSILIEVLQDGTWSTLATVDTSLTTGAGHTVEYDRYSEQMRVTLIAPGCEFPFGQFPLDPFKLNIYLGSMRMAMYGANSPITPMGFRSIENTPFVGDPWATNPWAYFNFITSAEYSAPTNLHDTIPFSYSLPAPPTNIGGDLFDKILIGSGYSGFSYTQPMGAWHEGRLRPLIDYTPGPPESYGGIKSPYTPNLHNQVIRGADYVYDDAVLLVLFGGTKSLFIWGDTSGPDPLGVKIVPISEISEADLEILDVAILSPSEYVVCSRASTYWTDDSGVTWNEATNYPTESNRLLKFSPTVLVAYSPGHGGSGTPVTKRSTDGGKTWVEIITPLSGFIWNYQIIDSNSAVFGRWRTSDAGLTWTLMAGAPTGLMSVMSVTSDIVVFATTEILISFDGGATSAPYLFQPDNTYIPKNGFWAVMFAWLPIP